MTTTANLTDPLLVTAVKGGWFVSGANDSVSAKVATRAQALALATDQAQAIGLDGFTLMNKLGAMIEYTVKDGKPRKGTVHRGAAKSAAPVAAEAPAQEAPSYAQFKVGEIYATRSICDHDCIFRWKIVKRTDKSVWVEQFYGNGSKDAPVRRSITISGYSNAEMIYPSGKYSMCPVLTADKPGDIG